MTGSEIIDWDWQPWHMWDGLAIAEHDSNMTAIAIIGATAMAREMNPEFSESDAEEYHELWETAYRILDNRGDL